jgi:hypothetical protein
MRLFERIVTWFEGRAMPADPRIGIDGMDINPATGLPTIAGVGTPDVAGNPYGCTRPHDCKHDWHRHDRWDSGAHDHFEAYNSRSASSHDPWRD